MKPIIKNLSVIILIGLIVLWSFIAGIERLIFFNVDYYPDFLVHKTISLDSKDQLYEQARLTCPEGNADLVEKKDAIYIRCGLFWPLSGVSKTYVNKPILTK